MLTPFVERSDSVAHTAVCALHEHAARTCCKLLKKIKIQIHRFFAFVFF
jgi:hypothetical protein